MKLLTLSADELRRALPMAAAIDVARRAFEDLSDGVVVAPQRLRVPVVEGDGATLVMPGYVPERGLATKIVSVFPGNAERGLPAVTGLVVVLDPATGAPAALLDGAFLTAWRTAAVAGAATDLLARPDARVAALFGCGAQARTQALALDAVRDLDAIRVYAPRPEAVRRFLDDVHGDLDADLLPAASPGEAVRGADVVCTATSASEPVLDTAHLATGVHVTAVGAFTHAMREVDVELVGRARVFVETRATARAESGELHRALLEGRTREEDWTELGDVLRDRAEGRRSVHDVTLFKSVGHAVFDVATATAAVARARDLGLGSEVAL